MKYIIGSIFLVVTLLLLTAFGFAVYQAITDSLTWVFVALPILASTVVAWLVTITAFQAGKQY